jgi:internalin A
MLLGKKSLAPWGHLPQTGGRMLCSFPLGVPLMRTTAFVLLLLLLPPVLGGQGQKEGSVNDRDTGGIDPQVIAAWEKAGAQLGWLSRDEFGSLTSLTWSPARSQGSAAIPVFGVFGPIPQGLKDLPAPAVPFGLCLASAPVTDADLKELSRFQQLQWLDLKNTGDSDAGLKELAGLKQLKSLDLSSTKISDAGLKELAGLKQLQSLDLSGTKISDVGLKEMAGLKQLQSLDLSSTKISDAGLKELAQLKQL